LRRRYHKGFALKGAGKKPSGLKADCCKKNEDLYRMVLCIINPQAFEKLAGNGTDRFYETRGSNTTSHWHIFENS
jgi:hypothetical protein